MTRRMAAAARVLAVLFPLHLSSVQAAPTPAETVDRFHQALQRNEPDKALDVLASSAIIYEQGFAETSRDEWVRNQLGQAIAFARDTERRVTQREVFDAGGSAWVISRTQTVVDVSDRKLMLEGAETAILRRYGDRWKIVHLHWSAHEASPEDRGESGRIPEPAAEKGRR